MAAYIGPSLGPYKVYMGPSRTEGLWVVAKELRAPFKELFGGREHMSHGQNKLIRGSHRDKTRSLLEAY